MSAASIPGPTLEPIHRLYDGRSGLAGFPEISRTVVFPRDGTGRQGVRFCDHRLPVCSRNCSLSCSLMRSKRRVGLALPNCKVHKLDTTFSQGRMTVLLHLNLQESFEERI